MGAASGMKLTAEGAAEGLEGGDDGGGPGGQVFVGQGAGGGLELGADEGGVDAGEFGFVAPEFYGLDAAEVFEREGLDGCGDLLPGYGVGEGVGEIAADGLIAGELLRDGLAKWVLEEGVARWSSAIQMGWRSLRRAAADAGELAEGGEGDGAGGEDGGSAGFVVRTGGTGWRRWGWGARRVGGWRSGRL